MVYWLLGTAVLVFAMVVIGGITRLTESGLSITDWRPVTGTVPPLSAADWQAEFGKYRQTPEFKKLNSSMTLEEFKGIYFWEYSHRLLGRVVGLAFAGPFFYLLSRNTLKRPLISRLTALLFLGGSQGALGWYMVKSGLEVADGEVPRVSQYRLAAHLGSAFAIYAGLLWTALDVHSRNLPVQAARVSPRAIRAGASLALFMTFVTAMSGAFVAGLDAGMVYNEFPWMGWYPTVPGGEDRRRLVPEDYWALEPPARNLFDNSAAVQFNHRWFAVATFATINGLWMAARLRLPAPVPNSLKAVLALAWAQVALGITTLLWAVPVPLAALHQAGSLALLSGCLVLRHRVRA